MNALGKNHRRSFFVLCFLCWQAFASAQVTANFSGTPLSGCSPLVVSFSDQSGGNPTQWKWDLGNGVTSLLQNPSATYFNPGTYTIKLVVRNASGVDSMVKTHYITVYASPAVNFAADKKSGCFPLPVNFTSQAAAGDGTITSWYWDFGDGTVSSLQDPSHTYTSAGSYSVTLKVTNSFGCTKTFTQPQYINVANGVVADFTNTAPGLCPPPTGVTFTNTSTGPGTLQYQWAFGDGSTSNIISPSHTYSTTGSYNVSLIVSSTQGCTDTVRKPALIVISNTASSFGGPDTFCVNRPVMLTGTSSPAPLSWSWNFGNGTTAVVADPVITYTAVGTYTIKLVNNFGGCFDSVLKQIQVVAVPAPLFDATPKSFCNLPAVVSFTNLTSGSSSVLWKFGDGIMSTDINPVHTYTEEGSFTVTLIVTNANGCSDSIVKPGFVIVKKPKIALTGLPRSGCTPLTVTPQALVSSGHTITGYQWQFGDGATSTLQNPSHTYTATGTYTVKLTYTTSDGCTDSTTFTDAVKTGSKPQAAFTYNPSDVCASQVVAFQNTSIGPSTDWMWNFTDGTTSTLQNPTHAFQDTGWFDVQLIVINNTCPDTIRIQNAVHVKPPIAKFLMANNCNDRYTKIFTDKSLGATSWFWDFGDGATSTQQNVTHTYTVKGTYSVMLTVSNGICSNSMRDIVKVVDEKALFQTDDPVVCRKQTLLFTSSGIDAATITNWLWTFGDGAAATTNPDATHAYDDAGTYKVKLQITDVLGCTDAYAMDIKVNGPKADFSASAPLACLLNNNIAFTDLSVSDGSHPVKLHTWSYGDGAIDSTSPPPYQHSYAAAGVYTVHLKIADAFGCTDTITKPALVTIVQPKAAFDSPDTITCTGKASQFNNASTGANLQYIWHFGDGAGSAAASPSHLYNVTGIYDVALAVTDQYGCKDSVSRPGYITVSYPKAKFLVSDTAGTCPPLLVNFYNQSSDYISKSWDFGDGSSSALDSPSHFYTLPGTYNAILTVKGPGGCTDVTSTKIVVRGPSGSFSYTPLTGCKPLTVTFNAHTKNNASFTWDFADGAIALSPDSVIQHTYTSIGDFNPKIILTDVAGCSVPIRGTETIKVAGVSTGFTMDASTFCNDGTVQFTNSTVGNDFITSYQWDFGDSSTSSLQHPSHHYTTPGLYSVSLFVTTQTGCKDSARLTDTIRVYPNPAITLSNTSSGCVPLIASFTASVTSGIPANLSWQWNFGNNKTDTLQQPAAQLYTTAGDYPVSATATDEHGCKVTDTTTITAYPIPAVGAGPDVYVCEGSIAQLAAAGAQTYQWVADTSLSCTSCVAPLAAPHDSTMYIVKGTSIWGCTADDSVIVRVHHPFVLQVGKGDTICVGKTVPLSASGAEQYTWVPSTGVSNSTAGTTTATPSVTTLYKVVAKDNAGCFTDTGYVNIKVWPYPKVEAGVDKTVSIGSSFLLQPTYSNDIVQYRWTNPMQTLSCVDCPAPMVHPKEAKHTYNIQVQNGGGCTTTDEITVYAICNGGNLFIPNTFSPNADGRNETFYPRGTGIGQVKSLRIYNRWGEEVFSGANFQPNNSGAGWDGMYKGKQLPPDVYVYTCEVVCMNNEVLFYKGDVTLLR